MADQPMTLAQAADVVGPVLRHADLTPREVVAIGILRDHAQAAPASVTSSPWRLVREENAAAWGAINRVLTLVQEWESEDEDEDTQHARQVRGALGMPNLAGGRMWPCDDERRSERSELIRLLAVVESLVRETDDPGTEALSAVYCAHQTVARAAAEPEHLTLSDGTELRHRTVKSLAEGTRDDSARWTPDTAGAS